MLLKPLVYPSLTTLVLISALCLIIYNEYIEFVFVRQSQWIQTHTHQMFAARETEDNDDDQVRVLFVGDPQIQGYRDEPMILGYVNRWDADQYLQK